MKKTSQIFQLYRPPLLDYESAWTLQKEWVTKILEEKANNLLLLVEHPPVYTIGRSGQLNDVLQTTFSDLTIPVIATDRGGKVTFHGPGQLVAYVVCDLRPHALATVRHHVNRLEKCVIHTLASFGISAYSDKNNPGVWVNGAKIGALGVRIRRGIAYHGIAINRDPNLNLFTGIVPCGLINQTVTSLIKLGKEVSRNQLEEHFLLAFQEVFGIQWATEKDTFFT